eukprot:TRINITY_DN66382_c0_g1_i1.p1 TRINITY_DN66382_c0_g1~~TRINITY_DN66382_c0_g1_i1.p1  ORF type:complete len:417 (+),score=125.65 TRINITY_DN66382_c0_g1_i1:179-1252(+)
MVSLKGGLSRMGTDDFAHNDNADGEGPPWEHRVKPFYAHPTPVTNEMFREFVEATGFQTTAEKDYGWSFVLSSLASEAARKGAEALDNAAHWIAVQGADWKHPEGPDSDISTRGDHPAVHISHHDAAAYCKWRGGRLPYETEWEFAARGKSFTTYPWGNDHRGKGDTHMMNVWQGKFPDKNTAADGYVGTSPVKAYPANPLGIYSAVGNVWEWTATVYSLESGETPQKFVLKGGSFVDSRTGRANHKVRVSTRMGQEADSGSHNTGFRCVADGDKGAPKPDSIRGGGGKAALKDQALLQRIAEEEGADGLREYMQRLGMGATVATPKELREQQAELKRRAAEEERRASGKGKKKNGA